MDKDYDVAVIGSGAGGAEAALLASRHFARVALIEKDALGGTALHTGTVPMRSLIASERLLQAVRLATEDDVPQDFEEWLSRQRRAVARWAGDLEEELAAQSVSLIRARATLRGEGRIEVSAPGETPREITARHIVIATGSRARAGEGDWNGWNEAPKEPPRSVVMVGGGHIGCEHAVVFNALGSRVTLVERSPHLLPEMDRDAGEWLEEEFIERGIRVITSRTAEVPGRREAGQVVVRLSPGDEECAADAVICATGRLPNVQNLGLEVAGVDFDAAKGITVTRTLATTARGVWAIGDVNGLCTLADSARLQAHVVIANIFGGHMAFHPRLAPRCVHTDPCVAAAGMTEQQALAADFGVRTGRASFHARSLLSGAAEADGLVKLFARADDGRLLGGLMVGADADTWVDELTTALAVGASAEQFASVPRHRSYISTALQECLGKMF